ncbi:hypothetical protein ACH3VR_22740 [Microbacterium sp. B2969]|uniref:Uncharacterized protein n=1 Tax=Microbacterium alkaliflavum TaxID=3248839 RepID=A0ABW7QEW0_9MICO
MPSPFQRRFQPRCLSTKWWKRSTTFARSETRSSRGATTRRGSGCCAEKRASSRSHSDAERIAAEVVAHEFFTSGLAAGAAAHPFGGSARELHDAGLCDTFTDLQVQRESDVVVEARVEPVVAFSVGRPFSRNSGTRMIGRPVARVGRQIDDLVVPSCGVDRHPRIPNLVGDERNIVPVCDRLRISDQPAFEDIGGRVGDPVRADPFVQDAGLFEMLRPVEA